VRRVIVGTGIDLCEVGRMRKAVEAEHGGRLVERVFTAREVAYARKKVSPYERFAARFAAKEAGMKALGTGWRGGVTWHDFEVANLASGKPTLVLRGRAAEIAAAMGVRNIALSLTHTAEQAMAMVILEDGAA
jgi:holo-[acyl-carrier protein] synthase